METTIMENQMEKKMENEMETGIIVDYIGVICMFRRLEDVLGGIYVYLGAWTCICIYIYVDICAYTYIYIHYLDIPSITENHLENMVRSHGNWDCFKVYGLRTWVFGQSCGFFLGVL